MPAAPESVPPASAAPASASVVPPASIAPAVTDPLAGFRGISASVSAETANDAASMPNAQVEARVAATTAPPRAGPSSDPACTAAVDIALPAVSRSPSSSDGMIANDAGMNNPSPAPMNAAIGPSAASETVCRVASTASAATSTHRIVSAASMTVRGPTLSASTPPTGISTVRGTP